MFFAMYPDESCRSMASQFVQLTRPAAPRKNPGREMFLLPAEAVA